MHPKSVQPVQEISHGLQVFRSSLQLPWAEAPAILDGSVPILDACSGFPLATLPSSTLRLKDNFLILHYEFKLKL
jgi:hypothetical protein